MINTNFLKRARQILPIAVITAVSYKITNGLQPTYKIQDRIAPKIENVTPTMVVNHKILVVDCFENSNVCINNDDDADVPHGEVVAKILENNLPNADIYKRSVGQSRLSLIVDVLKKSLYIPISEYSTINNLDTLFAGILKRNEKFDAINMSLGYEYPYDDLSELVGFDVNPENFREQKKRVRDSLATSSYVTNFGNSFKQIAEVLNKMDSITARETKIYISAGNDGCDALNLLALANGVECVGSRQNNGRKKPYTERHNLVTRYENDEFPIEKTDDGYDITGDGKTDFTFSQMAFPLTATHEAREEPLQGTSFATPNAIIKDILEFQK